MPGVFVKIFEDKFWGQWTDKKKIMPYTYETFQKTVKKSQTVKNKLSKSNYFPQTT